MDLVHRVTRVCSGPTVRRHGPVAQLGFVEPVEPALYPLKLLDMRAEVVCVVVLGAQFVVELVQDAVDRVDLVAWARDELILPSRKAAPLSSTILHFLLLTTLRTHLRSTVLPPGPHPPRQARLGHGFVS